MQDLIEFGRPNFEDFVVSETLLSNGKKEHTSIFISQAEAFASCLEKSPQLFEVEEIENWLVQLSKLYKNDRSECILSCIRKISKAALVTK